MHKEERQWRTLIFDWKASVIPAIAPKVLVAVGLAIAVTLAYYAKLPVYQDNLSTLIPALVLGLLLVFRTDTAYSRFWEGSQIISDIIDYSRGLARQVITAIDAPTEAARVQKITYARMVGIYLVSVKQHLRFAGVNSEMQPCFTPAQWETLQQIHHMPNQIAQWLGNYFQEQYQQGHLSELTLFQMNDTLNKLTLSMGSCERILTTPLPRAYAIHLKHLLLIYCLAIPFELVGQLYWGTPIAVGIIAFSLLGIEEIGLEIENPFGYDPNDLPLDQQSQELRVDIEAMLKGDSEGIDDLPTGES